jgi:hypothetical protein
LREGVSLIALRSGYRVPLFAREYKKNSASTRGKIVTEPSSFVIVLTTYPADRDATELARTLVGERLAACVNVLPPMNSVYLWEVKV